MGSHGLPCACGLAAQRRLAIQLRALRTYQRARRCALCASLNEALVASASEELQPVFAEIDAVVAHNLRRLQAGFSANSLDTCHITGSRGTDMSASWGALDAVVAHVMGTEAAICRLQLMSGTHAIASALFGVLRPGDELLAIAGAPYDTMEEVIGSRGTAGVGSLRDFGVTFRILPLAADGQVDYAALPAAITPGVTRVAHIQRSCGYQLRPTLTIDEIRRAVVAVKRVDPSIICVVDNCYGEFTAEEEPGHAGADLVMGSLIKNPGGTIVTSGGYIAGRADLLRLVAARVAAPGVDLAAVSLSGRQARTLFQGMWLAPGLVGEALKGGKLISEVLSRRGYKVVPAASRSTARPSFISAIEFGSAAAMAAFCEAVQRSSPVGSYIQPTPGVTPGYGDEVIFADGTFVDGSTAEMSADGPIRPPYVVYCQGGTHWTHWANVLVNALDSLDGALELA